MPAPHVLLFTGHRVDDPGRETPRFPPDKVEIARQEIGAAIDALLARHGKDLIGIAGAASGGDILFHEECHARGIETTIYLALPEKEYAEKSVDSAGAEWTRRYYALLEKTPVREGWRLTVGGWRENEPGSPANRQPPTANVLEPSAADDTVWTRSNLWMLHDALAHGSDRVTLIALWDGKAGDGPGGTEHMVKEIERRGGEVVRIGVGTVFSD